MLATKPLYYRIMTVRQKGQFDPVTKKVNRVIEIRNKEYSLKTHDMPLNDINIPLYSRKGQEILIGKKDKDTVGVWANATKYKKYLADPANNDKRGSSKTSRKA